MAERFYVNSSLGPGVVELDGPEARHLAAVCRARLGDRVSLFNGDGREYPAEVVEVGRRTVSLIVTGVETPQRELPFPLEVAAPLLRGDRGQFLVEKLTELGVTSYVPLRTERSVVEPRETKLERLQRHVIEASKQCGRNVLMQVKPLAAWEDYCRRSELPQQRLLAHPAAGGTGRRDKPGDSAVVVAVGPEGGFTDEEVAVAMATGWQAVDLGPRILRVETAALVLASWLAIGPMISTAQGSAAP